MQKQTVILFLPTCLDHLHVSRYAGTGEGHKVIGQRCPLSLLRGSYTGVSQGTGYVKSWVL